MRRRKIDPTKYRLLSDEDCDKYRDQPELITKYLNAAFATGDLIKMRKALGDMVLAHGASRLARETGLKRSNLYKLVNGDTFSNFDTVFKILTALRIQLTLKEMDD